MTDRPLFRRVHFSNGFLDLLSSLEPILDVWDARFLGLAEHIATWSKDPSTKVGAVIAGDDRRVVSFGFNGFPRGIADDHRLQNRETKYDLIVHAEANALLNGRSPVAGCTLYIHPFMPCVRCAGLVVQAGIKRVVAPYNENPRWQEDFNKTAALFREAGVLLVEVGHPPRHLTPPISDYPV